MPCFEQCGPIVATINSQGNAGFAQAARRAESGLKMSLIKLL
jgi:hypothetical protein